MFCVEDYCNLFLSHLNAAIDLYVPKQKISTRSRMKASKYPKYIKQMLIRKAALWRKWRDSRVPDLKVKYDEYAVKCKQAIERFNINCLDYFSKREFERSVNIKTNDLGKFYRFVNRKTSNYKAIPAMYGDDGKLNTNPTDQANIFNKYFASVFTVDNGVSPPVKSSQKGQLNDVSFTPVKICNVLKKLKTKFSSGPDGVPSVFFKQLADVLCWPLSFVFDASFKAGVLPACWLDAIVTPVFKKGATSKPENYRPISLTCICCRIMERVINHDMLDFLRSKGIITQAQHGFLRKHSTSSNLLESLRDWSIALNRRQSVDVIYIDFRKAFDSVSHPKLIIKLVSAGISGNLLNWIKAFLTNRTQSVKVADSLSNKIMVTSGVPQGSVLGPIADILIDLNVTMKLFADDVKMYSVVDIGISSDLLLACDRLMKWAETWQMDIAVQKCSALRVTNKINDLQIAPQAYQLNNVPLPWGNDCRDLGVLIDGRLNFNSHISLIVHNAHVRAQLILRSFRSRNRELLTRAFTTYVRPLLEYCSSVWNPHTLCNITKIESVQRAFTKRLSGLSTHTYNDRLRELKLETLEKRRLKNDLVMCYKLLHGNVESNFCDFFQLVNYTNTRGHNYKIAKQFSCVNAHKYNFPNRFVDAWNSLPVGVVNVQTESRFKLMLNEVVLDRFCVV